MRKISIVFVDFWDGFDYKTSIIYKILAEKYDVVISKKPEYVFYGPYGNYHLKYLDCIRIFYTGENISPDFNLCDYALAFDWLDFGDRYFRFPNYYGRQDVLKLCEKKHENYDPNETKKEFCSFVVSKGTEGSANPIREQIFNLLSEYKKVNSGGRYLNNIGMPNGVPDKLEFQKKHKFAIAFENSSQPGYTTEKIVDAFAANCIPIYWGDPVVSKVFNEKAFVNANNFDSLSDVVEKVKEIDNNDMLYNQMMSEPALIAPEYYSDVVIDELKVFLYNIIDQPYKSARRRPDCSYIVIYEQLMKKLLIWERVRVINNRYRSLRNKLGRFLKYSIFFRKK